MSGTRRIVVGLLSGFALLLMTRPVLAGECTVACVRARQVCSNAATQARRACKEECKAARSSAGGSFIDCFEPCKDDLAAAKATCKDAFSDCHEACIPGQGGGGGGACAQDCGATARTCLEDVKQAAFQCGATCQSDARAAAQACRTSGDPRCLLGVTRTLVSCLRGCAGTATSTGQPCVDGLRSCVSGCGGGSPSGAFLQ